MTADMTSSEPSVYEWHDEILVEEYATILDCLGDGSSKVFSIEKTDKGFRITELCDGYYGTTLTMDQLLRLIKELQDLAESETT